MNKFFAENLSWKIISLILASILWIFVINTQNPTQPQEIKITNIVINGLDELESAGYILKNKNEILNQNFKILAYGPRLETDKLVSDPSLVTATINLIEYMRDLTEPSISMPINYKYSINLDSNKISLKDKRPGVNMLVFEKVDVITRAVTAELSNEIKNNYPILGDPILSPTTIDISGPISDVKEIDSVKVFIDVEDFSEDNLVKSLPVKIYDVQGNEITGLTLSPKEIKVTLPMGKEKTVPLKINFKGEIPPGYILSKYEVVPKEVTITGKAEAVNPVQEIQLEAIDLSTVTQTDLIETHMILPEGVINIDPIDSEVTVSIEVTKETSYTYYINLDKIDLNVKGLEEGLNYEILTSSIELELSSTADELLKFNESQVTGVLNLTGKLEGEHTIELGLQVPESFKITNLPISVTVQINSPIEDEEEVTPPDSTVEDTETSTEEEMKEPSVQVGEG